MIKLFTNISNTGRIKKILLLSSLLFMLSCSSTKKMSRNSLVGSYHLKSDKLFQALSESNYSKLEINDDGTYILYKADVLFSPVIEQCRYASKGKWIKTEDNVIQITSENYYTKQNGFEYSIKKENLLNQDSLYIKVVLPQDFQVLNVSLTFNNNNSKSIRLNDKYGVLSKSKYLWNRSVPTNHISFSLSADVSGTEICKRRIEFQIFDEDIDTEKYNYLTISLPNFDTCFYEFEPYYQDFILIKGNNSLIWQGEIWEKTEKQ